MSQKTYDFKLSFFLGGLEKLQASGKTEETLQRIAQLGYKAVEFSATEPAEIDNSSLHRILDHLKLETSAWLTGGIYSRYKVCFVSPHPEVRAEAVRRLAALMPSAREFGTRLVVGLIQGQRTDAEDRSQARENIIECLKRVGEHAERQGVLCVFEPVNHLEVGFNHTVAEVQAVLKAVGSPSVRIMADTFHLNIEEASIEDPIRACGKELSHFHLCETNRCTFGSGHMEMKKVFQVLKEMHYGGYCTVVTEPEDWSFEAETAMRVMSHAL